GLRAVALLAGAPRRTAAAWPGDPGLPDPALEETERCGAVGLWPGPVLARALTCVPRRARRRRAAARMDRLRRELGGGRGAPDRALSWQAIEQLRFLRQEVPEEWPLERLAQGFGVSTDVVRRVLRGRGCPSPRRRLRQDQRALSAAATTPGAGAGREVRAPDGTLLYRLPRGWGGPGPIAQ
ncbi:NGRN protein, partial [Atrichornis clamosus]|nr:NGRN protein [Atrichornis clamosus]